MKKVFFIFGAVLLVFGASAFADDLKIDMTASNWSLPDADGKTFTMDFWTGKVLVINYVDPDESDLNEHFTEALKKAREDGLLNNDTYKAIGIADCASTWKPDFLIRAIAGRKAKKYNTVILFDYDASLRNSWGLARDTANVIILDKNRVCRAIVKGRVPDDLVEKLVKLTAELQ